MGFPDRKSMGTRDRPEVENHNWARQLVAALREIPFLDGRLLEDVTVETTGTDLAHGLGRVPRGFIPLGSTSANTAMRIDPLQDPTAFILRLSTLSADYTGDIWVF